MKNKPFNVLSADTEKLVKELSVLKPGEGRTYEQLNSLLPGRNLQHEHSYLLQSARRIALNQHQITILCVVGTGIKRGEDTEIANLGEDFRRRINRSAKRTGKQIATADFSKLSNDDKIKANVGLSLTGAMVLFTSRKQRDLLAANVQAREKKLEATEALKLPSVPEELFQK